MKRLFYLSTELRESTSKFWQIQFSFSPCLCNLLPIRQILRLPMLVTMVNLEGAGQTVPHSWGSLYIRHKGCNISTCSINLHLEPHTKEAKFSSGKFFKQNHRYITCWYLKLSIELCTSHMPCFLCHFYNRPISHNTYDSYLVVEVR